MSKNSSPDSLETQISRMLDSHLALRRDYQTISNKLTVLETKLENPDTTTHTNTSSSIHNLKLDVPRFDGSDPLGWIFKASQFFEYHETPENQRVRIAGFYMDGEALSWFQWLHENDQVTTWPALIQAIQSRFAPSQFEDLAGALFKLTQTATVPEYQQQFETLANRVVGLPAIFYLSCFISGLHTELQREVKARQPATLTEAMALAKVYESRFDDGHGKPPSYTPTTSLKPFRSHTTASYVNQPLKTPPIPSTGANYGTHSTGSIQSNKTPTIKTMTAEELQSRREHGLCYYCDDKYFRGHRCKSSFMVLLAPESPASVEEEFSNLLLGLNPPEPEPEIPPDSPPAQISLHALMGHSVPQTLRVLGRIGKSQVSILIDSGSTHNFLQERLVKFLGLQPTLVQGFTVQVGNGEELQCLTLCKEVDIHVGPHTFTEDLFVLPISGANVVLGVQWLKRLGPVLTDYDKLVMRFVKDGQVIQLQGIPRPKPDEITAQQFKKFQATGSISEYYHIQKELQSIYPTLHLEDKVFVRRGEDVTGWEEDMGHNKDKEHNEEAEPILEEEDLVKHTNTRPKRNRRLPWKFKDYKMSLRK